VELACPACRAAPPPLVPCDACEEEHDPFATAGACPRCALVWDALACPSCERRALLEAWVPDGAARRAFLARLLGGDPPPDDPQVGPWTAAWRKAARAVTTEVTELFAPVDETTDPGPLRAAILDAEDALEAARRGERELASIATDANAAALAIEVEAARKATRAAVESAQRALDGARRDAEELHRRLLDRERTPPVEREAPPEIVPNPAPTAQCPTCAWRPDGYPRWACTRCEAHFDAFATNARCPGCARRFVKTVCPGCKAWAPIDDWRRAGGGTPVEGSADLELDVGRGPKASPFEWLASRVAGALDRSDPRQETVAGSLERAAGATDRALDQVSGWFASLQDDGVGAARLGARDWSGVIDECTRTLRGAPEHAAALAFRGFARSQLNDDAGAGADYARALELEGLTVAQRASTLVNRAALRAGVCDFDGALTDVTAALLLDPKSGRGHTCRANIRYQLGLLDEALADVDAELLLETTESAPSALPFRAALQVVRRDWAAAEADATAALARGTALASLVYSIRAMSRAHQGALDGARADLVRTLRLAPAHGEAYALRAKLRASAGDVAGALLDLARLRRCDPWGERSTQRLALAIEAHLRGERERAVSLLRAQRARDSQPEYAALWLALLLGEDEPPPAPRGGWAGELLRFSRGEITYEALVELAADPAVSAPTVEERRCEAHGYAGLRADRDGRPVDAQRCYEACASEPTWAIEPLWARLRLAGASPRAARAEPAPASPPPTVTPTASLIDQLERLARLREQGVLTPEEFALAKRRILDG
jgi:tetratricopeptide (TPR) repeat protein